MNLLECTRKDVKFNVVNSFLILAGDYLCWDLKQEGSQTMRSSTLLH
jgi:hypothetical protein